MSSENRKDQGSFSVKDFGSQLQRYAKKAGLGSTEKPIEIYVDKVLPPDSPLRISMRVLGERNDLFYIGEYRPNIDPAMTEHPGELFVRSLNSNPAFHDTIATIMHTLSSQTGLSLLANILEYPDGTKESMQIFPFFWEKWLEIMGQRENGSWAYAEMPARRSSGHIQKSSPIKRTA